VERYDSAAELAGNFLYRSVSAAVKPVSQA